MAQSWRDFVTFGEEKLDYLRRFLPFDNGIPSKNTYARVFSILNQLQKKAGFGDSTLDMILMADF